MKHEYKVLHEMCLQKNKNKKYSQFFFDEEESKIQIRRKKLNLSNYLHTKYKSIQHFKYILYLMSEVKMMIIIVY